MLAASRRSAQLARAGLARGLRADPMGGDHSRKHRNSNVSISSGFVKDPVVYSPEEPPRLERWKQQWRNGMATAAIIKHDKSEKFDPEAFCGAAEEMLTDLYDAVNAGDVGFLNEVLIDKLVVELKRGVKRGQVDPALLTPQEVIGFTAASKVVQYRSFAWGGRDRRFVQATVQSRPVSVPPRTPLPEGWREAQAPDGGVYYYHEESQHTTWDRGDALMDSPRAFDSVQLTVFERPLFPVPAAANRWRICGLPEMHEVAVRGVAPP